MHRYKIFVPNNLAALDIRDNTIVNLLSQQYLGTVSRTDIMSELSVVNYDLDNLDRHPCYVKIMWYI